jgi:hypothetical protein
MRTIEGSLLRTTVTAAGVLVAVGLIAPAGCGGEFTSVSDGGTQDTGSPETGPADARSDARDSSHPDTSPPDSSPPDTSPPPDGPPPETPTYHRPNDSQCATKPAPGDCTLMEKFTCTTDSQCTDGGVNGRCIESNGGALDCYCTYDMCQMDTDCLKGELCVCHGSAYTDNVGNTCMPGDCRIDSDCGPDGFCSPTHGTSGCGAVTGYYCHTAKDTCVNDSDCGTTSFDVCAWSAAQKRWECQMFTPCA